MAGVETRLAEARAALATLDEVAGKAVRSLIERDGGILRLIYTFEALWKACQRILAEREGVIAASPNATIRAHEGSAGYRTRTRKRPWLSAMTVILLSTCTAARSARKLNHIWP